jgi:hypothetical protein
MLRVAPFHFRPDLAKPFNIASAFVTDEASAQSTQIRHHTNVVANLVPLAATSIDYPMRGFAWCARWNEGFAVQLLDRAPLQRVAFVADLFVAFVMSTRQQTVAYLPLRILRQAEEDSPSPS